MFVFAPAPQAVVPVSGEKNVFFPVNRVYCVGRNYADHDKEMGGTGKTTPCFFAKPADAIFPIDAGKTAQVPFPQHTENLQHEVELVVAVGKSGKDLTVEQAAECIWGWAVGVDWTGRVLLAEAKAKGRPWTTAKSFDYSGPVSHIVRKENELEPSETELWLYVKNECKQKGSTRDKNWSEAEVLAEISSYWELKAGELVFTGSPSGVSTLHRGDIVRAGCNGIGMIEFELV